MCSCYGKNHVHRKEKRDNNLTTKEAIKTPLTNALLTILIVPVIGFLFMGSDPAHN